MTPYAKDPQVAATEGQDQHQDQQADRPRYEAPALVPLGNVHALLAGVGMSPVLDSNKIGMRNGSG